jgi:hypothetical protein
VSMAALAIILSLSTPQSSVIFQATAAILLIGGGIQYLFSFSSRNTILSTLVVLPIILCLVGFPLLPGQWVGSFLMGSLQEQNFIVFLLLCSALFLFSLSLFRMASQDNAAALSHPKPVQMLAFSCALLAFPFVGYPGFNFGSMDALWFIVPTALVLLSFLCARFMARRILPNFELDFPIQLDYLGRTVVNGVDTLKKGSLLLERVLNGEGALFWSFSIILLFWIVFKGL